MLNQSVLNELLAAAAGVFCLAAILLLRKLWGIGLRIIVTGMGRQPFEIRPVMNRGEDALYRQLLDLAPRGTYVLPQVQMSGFLQVKGLSNHKERWKYLSQIIKLSVDFLIVDARTLKPMVAIELDGPSHDLRRGFASGQMDADARKSRALRSAGVPLIRLPVRSAGDIAELRRLLKSALGR